MSLSKDEVEHIAKLGRLAISAEEVELYSKELSQILNYVDTLKEVDTKDVEPMTGAIEFSHVTRPDESTKIIDRDELLKNAPDLEDTAIKVPKMAA